MSRIPNFSGVELGNRKPATDYDSWKKEVEAKTGRSVEEMAWRTMEMIDVKPLYTADDLKDCRAPELLARPAAVPAWPVRHHVCHTSLDRTPVRRVLHGGRVQRVLPSQLGRRAEGPECGV